MAEEEKLKLSKSRTFLSFCFCFLAGIAIGTMPNPQLISTHRPVLLPILSSLFVLLILVAIFTRHKTLLLLSILLSAVFSGGVWRAVIFIPQLNRTHIAHFIGENITFYGTVATEPNRKNENASYVMSDLLFATGQKINGKILLVAPLYPRFIYGERLSVNCRLLGNKNYPNEYGNFNYERYLARDKIYARCFYPQIQSLGINSGNKFFYWLFNFKERVTSVINNLWPEPDGSLIAGVLYGARSALPQSVSEDFRRAGVSHIVAISGYNVSILVIILLSALTFIGLHRRQAFYLLLLFITLLVLFTGMSASVTRAAVMGAILLLGQYWGRPKSSFNAIIFAAVWMAALNPYILLWDPGFALSFLATIGLLYLSPLLGAWWQTKFNPAKKEPWQILGDNLATTFSAIAVTLPYSLYEFGQWSIIAPVANLLILWSIPWLMLLSFLALIFSFVLGPFALAAAFPAYIFSRYVIITSNHLASLPWSATQMSIPFWLMLLIYGALYLGIKKRAVNS